MPAESVTAVTRGEIVRAQVRAQRGRDELEQLVAARVTELVVDTLEPVEVEDRERRGDRRDLPQPARYERAEGGAVVQTGPGVAFGLAVKTAHTLAVRSVQEGEADAEERKRQRLEERGDVGELRCRHRVECGVHQQREGRRGEED